MRKDYKGGERVVCGEKNTKKQKNESPLFNQCERGIKYELAWTAPSQ